MKGSTMRDLGISAFGLTLISAILLFSGIFSSGTVNFLLGAVLLGCGGFTTCMLDSYIERLKAGQEAASKAVSAAPAAASKTAA